MVDRESEPGGLARTVTDANGFSWDLGVHVTGASRFRHFLDMADEVITDWNVLPRFVKVGARSWALLALAPSLPIHQNLLEKVSFPPSSSLPLLSGLVPRVTHPLRRGRVPVSAPAGLCRCSRMSG